MNEEQAKDMGGGDEKEVEFIRDFARFYGNAKRQDGLADLSSENIINLFAIMRKDERGEAAWKNKGEPGVARWKKETHYYDKGSYRIKDPESAATENQKRFLEQRGIETKGMTKGEASTQIDAMKKKEQGVPPAPVTQTASPVAQVATPEQPQKEGGATATQKIRIRAYLQTGGTVCIGKPVDELTFQEAATIIRGIVEAEGRAKEGEK